MDSLETKKSKAIPEKKIIKKINILEKWSFSILDGRETLCLDD